MQIDKIDGRSIVWDNKIDWVTISKTMTEHYNCLTEYTGIFQYIPTGKFYQLIWTEDPGFQGQVPFQYNTPNPIEVVPVEKVVISYEPVK